MKIFRGGYWNARRYLLQSMFQDLASSDCLSNTFGFRLVKEKL